ncbi:AsmA-like C-terminal region-containing protein [Sagittula stellata]|nr:AsmA-like C-terminal region-containing protein [Sagittula stellata]
MQQATEKSDAPRRRRKVLVWCFGVVLALAVGIAGGIWAMLGRPVDAPDWLRERIETRIAENLRGISIDFGRMSLLITETGLARIVLWDVTVTNDQGVLVAQLSDIEAGVAPVSFLRREWELREAQVSGAFVTLQRDRNGKLGLALGDAFAEGTQVPDLAQIIARIDAIAMDPRLAKLDLFEADSLTLRYEDLRARRGWTADGGRLRLMREDGTLRLTGDVALLSGGAGVATVELGAESRIGDASLDFGITLQDLDSGDIATQSPALAWMDALEAPISGSLQSTLAPDGALGEMRATLEIGKGVLQPNREARPVPFDGARTAFTYLPEERLMRFDEIRVDSAMGRVRASGTTMLDDAPDGGLPPGLTAQFRLASVEVAESAVMDRPVVVEGAQTAFRLQLDPFRVDIGSLRITDPTLPISARGWLEATRSGWSMSLDARVAETVPEQVMAFWPDQLVPQTRDWVGRNVREGRLFDASFALRAEAGADHPTTFFDLSFEDAVVGVAPNLPPIEDGRGRLTIHQRRLGLRVDAGRIVTDRGAIDVAGSVFTIPDLKKRPSVGEVDLKIDGPVGAVLAYVDNDQWRVLRNVGRDATLADGRIKASGRLVLPLAEGLTFDDIQLAFDGTLRDVESAKAIPGKTIRGDGLSVKLDNGGITIAGQASVSGVPVDGRWTQPFGGESSEVVADITISPKSLSDFGVSLPNGMLRGQGTGALRVTLPPNAPPRFSLESDLAGLGLAVPQIGWSLAPRTKGRFTMAGNLTPGLQDADLTLKGAGMDAAGQLVLSKSGAFERLDLSRVKVADWLDVAGRLRARGGNSAPAVEISSGRVDLRSAPFGASGAGGSSGGGGGPLVLTLDSLRVTDSIELRAFRGNFDTARGIEGRFDGQLGGATPVAGQVIPQSGGSAFRITGEDAGDILKAAGLLKTVKDGTFNLDLAPVSGQPGSFDGLMRIQGTRMQKAPAIASLLDAISIVGIIDQMNGPGIFFSDVEARFRLTPSRVILSESSAVGPSMGISMDGYYDLGSGQMDFQGVLSPIYAVNAIGRLIARKGEGLIGFNFNLRGTVGAPRVAVNPLSVFTPGMFRDIFRRPPPKLSQ